MLRCRLNQFKEVTNGPDFFDSESFNGKVAANDEDGKGVEIVCEKTTRFISEANNYQTGIEAYVALIPPKNVYIATPSGSKNVAAMM